MKRILTAVLLIATVQVQGARLISDYLPPAEVATHCVYQDGTATAVETTIDKAPTGPQLGQGRCNIDLSAASVGTHNFQVWYLNKDWGIQSTQTAFSFTRSPTAPVAPTGLRIEAGKLVSDAWPTLSPGRYPTTCSYAETGQNTVQAPTAQVTSGVEAGRWRCEFDLKGLAISTGQHTLNVTAADPWGLASAASPLSFTKPGAISAPTGFSLTP